MTNTITKPPFTNCQIKGSTEYWRFRRGDIVGKLPGSPADPEGSPFWSTYDQLLNLSNAKPIAAAGLPAQVASTDTVKWLMNRYLKSAEYSVRAEATKLDYAKIIAFIETTPLAAVPYKMLTMAMVKELRDKVTTEDKRARKAHKIKQILSLVYTYAQQCEMVPLDFNPAKKLARLKVKSGEIICWSDEEIALVLNSDKCPAFVRTAILLALHTGQRREDIVTMDWNQVQGSIIRVKQSKTDALLDLTMHSELKAHLDAVDIRKGKIIRNARGQTMAANALSQALRSVVNAIDEMPKNRSMHGLRYAAAARLEEAGCSAWEIASVTGHRAFQMAMKYASQRKRSAAANAKQEAHQASQQA